VPPRRAIMDTMSSKTLSILAVIIGIVLVVLAFVYWLTPANALPSYMPGYDPSLSTVHFKHGLASLLLGLALALSACAQQAGTVHLAVADKAGDALGVDPSRCFSGLSSCQKLIDCGAEVVILENIPSFMPDQATAAVKAGRHVYMAKPVAAEQVGKYALRFVWNDNHNLGIYSWNYLREVCPCAECASSHQASGINRP